MTTDTTRGDDQRLALRAYSVLATALGEMLAEARRALLPHQSHLPGGTLASLDELIAEFQRKRIRIALFGEVKAGKSTLLNAIAGAALSPMAFDPLTSIPVRVTWGSSTRWRVADRSLASIEELEQVMRSGSSRAAEVVVETALDLLQLGGQVDLLDTPGVGSDEHFDAVTDEVVRSLDAVVLVVRYPALFTQVTRRLVERLDSDVGKLFVVWNLDGACDELTTSQCEQHAAALKANVAGAHELNLVDARAALRAAGDSTTLAASGLTAFVESIARFVSSTGRDVAALREAAKRSEQWLRADLPPLQQRQAAVEQDLAAAQSRIDAVQAAAQREADALRARQGELEAGLAQVAQQAATAANQRAATLRSKLHAARRGWIRNGDLRGLETAVNQAVRAHAEETTTAAQSFSGTLLSQAASHDAHPSLPPWGGGTLPVERLTSEDRNVRATTGSLRRLRRALWRRWYLPGLATLEGGTIDGDLAAQAAWRDSATQVAVGAGREILAARLDAVTARATDETESIKRETGYAELDAEARRLREDIPTLESQIAAAASIADEARKLIRRA